MSTTKVSRYLCVCVLSLSLAIGACGWAHAAKTAAPRWTPEREAQVGREIAGEVDQEYDRVDNPELAAKIQRMADEIGLASTRPEVKYDVRLVVEKRPGPKPEVNAFSIPGGYVYVTKGLVDDSQSDDELAGVLAHEISHHVTYDGLDQAERAGKVFKGEMAAVLAAVLIGGLDNPAWAQIMQAGELVRQGILGGYSIMMETRADANAVRFMSKTTWNPVGLLTFMERLAAEERRSPPPEMGVYQTHPLSGDRVLALISRIEDVGVFINRRATTKWPRPTVEERPVNGHTAQAVVYRDEVIFATDAAADGLDPKQRADRVATQLATVLADGAESYSFRNSQVDGRPALVAYGETILVVEAADAALANVPPAQVVNSAREAIRRALLKERLDRLW
jgi:Zn-dependent protease with chaperone function